MAADWFRKTYISGKFNILWELLPIFWRAAENKANAAFIPSKKKLTMLNKTNFSFSQFDLVLIVYYDMNLSKDFHEHHQFFCSKIIFSQSASSLHSLAPEVHPAPVVRAALHLGVGADVQVALLLWRPRLPGDSRDWRLAGVGSYRLVMRGKSCPHWAQPGTGGLWQDQLKILLWHLCWVVRVASDHPPMSP